MHSVPRVTVGDGCVIFPASIVSADLKAGLSLVPAQKSTTTIPTAMISAGLEDPAESKRAVMAEFLDLLASHYPGSRMEPTKAGRVLLVPGQGRVILLSGESRGALDSQDAVICLLRRQEGAQTPCFAFERVTFFGPWTPFAEPWPTTFQRSAGRTLCSSLQIPRIENPRRRVLKVTNVARDHSQAVRQRGCCD